MRGRRGIEPDGFLMSPLIAVDVGNSRIKWGLFISGRLAQVAVLPIGDRASYDQQLERWQLENNAARWSIASVNGDGTEPLVQWLANRGFSEPCVIEDPASLPLRIAVERPQAVGIDRLLDAVAANARRPQGRSAIIVDAGSAITVDVLALDGTFIGGAIAIGMGMAARALHEFTYYLPLVSATAPPDPVAKSTAAAMHSGLFWGTVGAIKELVRRMESALSDRPIVYLTGGDAEQLVAHLERPVEFVPELTLHGIQLAYEHIHGAARP
jgi:type III pantothenate kinase